MFAHRQTGHSGEGGRPLLFELVVLATPEVISPARRFVAASLPRLHFDEDVTWRMELGLSARAALSGKAT